VQRKAEERRGCIALLLAKLHPGASPVVSLGRSSSASG